MSPTGDDEYYVLVDGDKQPLWLVKWPGNGLDPLLWRQSHGDWVQGWPTLMDEVHPLVADSHAYLRITADEAVALKDKVHSPSDEKVARWAAYDEGAQ